MGGRIGQKIGASAADEERWELAEATAGFVQCLRRHLFIQKHPNLAPPQLAHPWVASLEGCSHRKADPAAGLQRGAAAGFAGSRHVGAVSSATIHWKQALGTCDSRGGPHVKEAGAASLASEDRLTMLQAR